MPPKDAGNSNTGSLSHLPWGQIPGFKPGETDLTEWTKKVEFLAQLWPQEHLQLLAPRIALQCEGSAFQRVSRLDPKELRVNGLDGVKTIVEALGGIWGKSRLEDKFEKFEKAIYGTVQRSDETHESYLARHDHQFEELMGMKVGIEEFRAYILLRNSSMSADDKKRLIVESQGSLDYRSVVNNLKLLGSRFFHEVHTGKPNTTRTKTYDTTALFTEDEPQVTSSPPPVGEEEQGFVLGEHYVDEYLIEQWAEEGDPDAVVCMQFEEGVMDTLQGDPDMAACFNAYTDARKRLADRAKGRGFWGPSKKGFGKDRKGKGGRSNFRPRKPLAQRILESNCRRCGARGHWKAECPLRNAASGNTAPREGGTFTGLALHELDTDPSQDDDMIPIEAPWKSWHDVFMVHHLHEGSKWGFLGTRVIHEKPGPTKSAQSCVLRLLPALKAKLGLIHSPLTESKGEEPPVEAATNFVSHGSLGIVDLGASQTVIGEHQVTEVIQQLPKSTKIQEVPCSTVFRFGNSSTVACDRAMLVPLGPYYVKVCIVPSKTPFLLSNNLFRKLEASIHTATDEIFFGRLNLRLPLQLTEKKLYLLDFAELVRQAQKNHDPQARGTQKISSESILTVGEALENPLFKNPSTEASSFGKPSINSGNDSKVSDQRDSCPRPGVHLGVSDRHVEQHRNDLVRPFQGPADSSSGRSAGSRSDVNRGAVHGEDQLRGRQERPNVSGSPANRSEVRELVPQPLPGQHQALTQDVCELSPSVHRNRGDQPGSHRDSNSGPDQGIPEGQSWQRKPSSHPGRECSLDERRDVGHGGGRAREPPPRSGNRTAESAHQSDGEHSATNTSSLVTDPPSAGTVGGHHRDQDQVSRVTGSETLPTAPCEVKSMIMDCIGHDVLKSEPQTVLDPAYFQELDCGAKNPIYSEMMRYFGKHYGTSEAIDRHLNRIGIDLLRDLL